MIGTSGSGKTTVAEALARILEVPYICNDAIIWGPNWQPVPRDAVYQEIEEATRGDYWTFDGNLNLNNAEDLLILERCDTIVWLDLPRREVWWQITRRTIERAFTREPMWHGNVERWRMVFSADSMIWWSIKTFNRRRRSYTELFQRSAGSRWRLIRLRSRAELDRWLHELSADRSRSLARTGE